MCLSDLWMNEVMYRPGESEYDGVRDGINYLVSLGVVVCVAPGNDAVSSTSALVDILKLKIQNEGLGDTQVKSFPARLAGDKTNPLVMVVGGVDINNHISPTSQQGGVVTSQSYMV